MRLKSRSGWIPLDFTGKPMKGFVFVEERVLSTKKQLAYWVQLALEFNKIAKSSKKKQGARKTKK